MAIWTRIPLSGSTNGRPITIDGVAAPGTTIHTVSTATAIKDMLYLWVYNAATTNRTLNALWGTTASGSEMPQTILAQDGMYAICPGITLNGATGIITGIWATATGALFVVGYVNRAT